jgi:hypothetical protein
MTKLLLNDFASAALIVCDQCFRDHKDEQGISLAKFGVDEILAAKQIFAKRKRDLYFADTCEICGFKFNNL